MGASGASVKIPTSMGRAAYPDRGTFIIGHSRELPAMLKKVRGVRRLCPLGTSGSEFKVQFGQDVIEDTVYESPRLEVAECFPHIDGFVY